MLHLGRGNFPLCLSVDWKTLSIKLTNWYQHEPIDAARLKALKYPRKNGQK